MFFFVSFIFNSFREYIRKKERLSFILQQHDNIIVNYKFLKRLSRYITKFKYIISGKVYSNSVISGKDGWLFYSNSLDGGGLADYEATNYPNEKAIKQLQENLKYNLNYLNNKNIDFAVFIAPNNGNIYRNNLPNSVKYSNKTTTEYTIECMKKIKGLKIIYPQEELIEKADFYQVCLPLDSHWNSLGAYIGYSKLMLELFNVREKPIESFTIKKRNIGTGDLVRLLKLEDVFPNSYDYYINELDSEPCEDLKEYRNENAVVNKSILFIGDSYRLSLSKYLRRPFKRFLMVHMNDYKYKIIDDYKPDFVIFERAGRYCYMPEFINFKL
jgi:hypothetical protein